MFILFGISNITLSNAIQILTTLFCFIFLGLLHNFWNSHVNKYRNRHQHRHGEKTRFINYIILFSNCFARDRQDLSIKRMTLLNILQFKYVTNRDMSPLRRQATTPWGFYETFTCVTHFGNSNCTLIFTLQETWRGIFTQIYETQTGVKKEKKRKEKSLTYWQNTQWTQDDIFISKQDRKDFN